LQTPTHCGWRGGPRTRKKRLAGEKNTTRAKKTSLTANTNPQNGKNRLRSRGAERGGRRSWRVNQVSAPVQGKTSLRGGQHGEKQKGVGAREREKITKRKLKLGSAFGPLSQKRTGGDRQPRRERKGGRGHLNRFLRPKKKRGRKISLSIKKRPVKKSVRSSAGGQ